MPHFVYQRRTAEKKHREPRATCEPTHILADRPTRLGCSATLALTTSLDHLQRSAASNLELPVKRREARELEDHEEGLRRQLRAPVPSGREPPVDARAGVEEIVRARAVETIPARARTVACAGAEVRWAVRQDGKRA